MPSVSRLREFEEIYSHVRSSQADLPPPQSVPSKRKVSEFHRHAAALTADLNRTMAKLQQLAQFASSKSLFAYPAAQIEELTMIIKQDIGLLSARLDDLQALCKRDETVKSSAQSEEHSEHVMAQLKNNLMDTTKQFQSVLQQSSVSMKKQDSRRTRFVSSPQHQHQPHGHLTAQPNTSNPNSSSSSSSSGVSGVSGTSSGGHQMQSQTQMQVARNADQSYYEQRADAVQNIEQTIVELGGMFQQLAAMVAEQGDVVQRIDADMEDTLVNVEAGHNELIKYFKGLSSNRWLALKIFAVLLVFIIFFTVVVV
jgi:syntaxin 5